MHTNKKNIIIIRSALVDGYLLHHFDNQVTLEGAQSGTDHRACSGGSPFLLPTSYIALPTSSPPPLPAVNLIEYALSLHIESPRLQGAYTGYPKISLLMNGFGCGVFGRYEPDSQVLNVSDNSIVLPKIWKHNTCILIKIARSLIGNLFVVQNHSASSRNFIIKI